MLSPSPLYVPCAAGVEPLLAEELQRILTAAGAEKAAQSVRPGRAGVSLVASAASAMRLHLESRLAQRVLWQVAHGPYRSEMDLYDLARDVEWHEWMTPRQTLRVDTTAVRSPVKSLHFAGLRIKDALCDAMREKAGERPNVDPQRPDLSVVLHLTERDATLYVDLSGEALFKRGWREAKGEAPLKETLAAAMLAAAGWQGRPDDGPLLDPCCGAGTIAIEAAQIACGIAPGLQRSFAFERLTPFRSLAPEWQAMKAAARAAVHAPSVPVYAGDVSFRMTDFATRNAERAGVAHAIEFKTADALQRPAPAEHGVLVMNPPYGERIEAKGTGARERFEGDADPAVFFGALATHWKRQYAGWTAWVLSPDAKLPQAMRLKESRRVPMWNGPIECRLFRFDLVAGSNRGASTDGAARDAGQAGA